MDVRQRTEEIEHMTFAPWATFSDQSRGRMLPEEQDPIRPVFQRDRDRVLHCKAFRRLKQKTQVFLSPEGDLYRTRLTHTLEVSQIARTIARALRLNEDLTEAISLAHDLGHTPFGHAGERALNELCPDGFKHYMQSLRVVDKLEKDGRGLNLTWEVRNGIVTHTKGTWAATPEGRIVRMADQIAYVNHDIEDAVRAGVLDPATLPKECTAVLGQTKSARVTTMINSILANSDGDVKVGAEENEAFLALRDFMYATVYVDKTAKREEQKVDKVIGELYDYYLNHVDRMSNFYIQLAYQEGGERAVTDYISGMSSSVSRHCRRWSVASPQAAHQQIQRMQAGQRIGKCQRDSAHHGHDLIAQFFALGKSPCFTKVGCHQSQQNIGQIQRQQLCQLFRGHSPRSCSLCRTLPGSSAAACTSSCNRASTEGRLSLFSRDAEYSLNAE